MVWVPDRVIFAVATAWQVPSMGWFRAARARGAFTCPVPPCAMETVAPPAAVCPYAAASCAPEPLPMPVILLVPIAMAPDMVPPARGRLAACAVLAAPAASNAVDACVAAVPSPRFVLAVEALARSLRLFASCAYRRSVCDSGRSPDWTSQIPALYCIVTP